MNEQKTRLKTILMIMPYFGLWPPWMEFFLESCKYNPTVNWLFFTDCGEPNNKCPNVRYVHLSFQAYQQLVSERLGIPFSGADPYKLCDIKPAYGFLHQDALAGYDYFGFGDIDIIYGNIRKFYDDYVLSHNLISTHYRRLSGHLCLLKNTPMIRNAFRRIKNWEGLMSNPQHQGLDESKFSKLFLRHKKYPPLLRKVSGIVDKYQRSCLFVEHYSTIESKIPWTDGTHDYPNNWFWRKGKLTNDKDQGDEFLYLHFASWKNRDWKAMENIVHTNPQNPRGWCISRKGFRALQETPTYHACSSSQE